jgi:Helix-turn-helix domain
VSGVRIGSSLEAARERRGLSLADAANALCIREPFLAALEQEHPNGLPGDAYARAFLRSYAEFLGLDSSLLLAEWDERFGPVEQGEIGPHRPLRAGWQPPVRPLVAAGLAALLLGAGGVFALGISGGPTSTTTQAVRPTTVREVRPRRATPRRPPAVLHTLGPVPLYAVGAWDPYGDRAEHDSEAGAATDGSSLTFWRTETYSAGLTKPGVGLLLDAGRPVALRRLDVSTDTPGFRAVIEAGPGPTGPFHPVSVQAAVAPRTTFTLRGGPERFFVVWITRLDRVAHVDGVGAFGERTRPRAAP